MFVPILGSLRKVRYFTKEIYEQRTPHGVLLRYLIQKTDPLHRLALILHGRVDIQPQGGTHIAVAQQLADAFGVHPLLDTACGIGMPQGVNCLLYTSDAADE